ncbi:AMP-binding enzyme family protein [Trichomonas vaginalis G3]|uniref:AMP-binding enzyme family protein n=1 Tax=Trichomonas vaginalis (strain ATCC PRA-98 / G3) TaxID=412133 RepID=A2ERH8_TRIV3|nr:long chain fatty acid--CoA ligase family [Trichomonas vaginalis G3]EAY04705.1 AMP-binding enzyme family protein [Trichomonas vaginalis G3]KAI5526803.1 long chain fatty acid--CoA ligase family [Trichomonas vaginalis G3]|eukprot:XP_001316928.1 AMP-binding enzyme family protein [Trichomonas vaginalis G3]
MKTTIFSPNHVPVRSLCQELPGTATEGYSPIYRNNHCFFENGGEFISTFRCCPHVETMPDLIKTSAGKWPDEPAVGERAKNPDGTMGEYKWLPYRDFYQQVLAFGRGLLEMGLKRGDHIGIYSSNSIWWETINFGAGSVGICIVPIYDSLGPTAAEFIIEDAGCSVIFTSEYKLPQSIEISHKTGIVKKIVQMSDKVPGQSLPNVEFDSCQHVLEMGRNSTQKNEFSLPDDDAIIMYTSGSTGTPKGCPLTQKNIIAGAASFVQLGVGVTPDDCYLSFLPLAHIYAVVCELIGFAHGAHIGYTRGVVKYLVEDIQMLKPTAMIVVPRLLNRISEGMKSQIEKKPKWLQYIINKAIDYKANQILNGKPTSWILDRLIFDNFRQALGGKLRLVVNGGAPIMDNVARFCAAALTPNIIQGYGLTETAAGVLVQEVPLWDTKSVGACGLACEIKLNAVPGTNYDAKGKNPTGEILVRGPNIFKGYYKRPDLTKEAFDEDGWFMTGDVATLNDDMHMTIIDRIKNLVKLCQGEYISLTSLNEIYAFCEKTLFVFVYADPQHDFPVALCVPKKEVVDEWKAKGINDVVNSKECKDELIKALEDVKDKYHLRGFERIQRVLIDLEEPTIENGLLTPSMKPQYAALKAKYEQKLIALYNE